MEKVPQVTQYPSITKFLFTIASQFKYTLPSNQILLKWILSKDFLMYRRWAGSLFAAVFFSTTLLGCSGGSNEAGLYPVKGIVLIDGKPVEHIAVSLVPVDASGERRPVGGFTNEDGEFSLTAEPGEYWASISWMKLLNPKSSEPDYGPELLPAKYQDPAKSGLKELRVTIEEGDNELPKLELSSKR
jgi:hypothetical protein